MFESHKLNKLNRKTKRAQWRAVRLNTRRDKVVRKMQGRLDRLSKRKI